MKYMMQYSSCTASLAYLLYWNILNGWHHYFSWFDLQAIGMATNSWVPYLEHTGYFSWFIHSTNQICLQISVLLSILEFWNSLGYWFLGASAAAEALLACKSALDSPGQSSDKIERYPCIRQRACLSCYIAKDTGVVSL